MVNTVSNFLFMREYFLVNTIKDEWDINEYERSIELIVKYLKGNINYTKM